MKVTAFVALVAAGSAYLLSVLVDLVHWNALIPLLAVAVILAVFARRYREAEIRDVVGPALLVSFAGYLGVAAARVAHTNVSRPEYVDALGPFARMGTLWGQWPLLIVGGLVFAVALTALVAIPVSQLATRPKRDPHADDRFWQFVRERNEGPPKD